MKMNLPNIIEGFQTLTDGSIIFNNLIIGIIQIQCANEVLVNKWIIFT